MEVKVSQGYPCWVEFIFGDQSLPGSGKVRMRHTDLLALEALVKTAKRDCLMNLPKSHWHEIDPDYAKS